MAGNNAKTREKSTKLRSNQNKAIEAFLLGGNVTIAAHMAGVSERTIYTWRQDPDFKAALLAASDEQLADTVLALSGASLKAVRVLVGIMMKESTKDVVKIQAAALLLSNSLRLRELFGLEQRVRELEERAGS